ncbi:MAG: hypothetical protein DWH97_06040 [Planctomycetota bacterium]|nr:MAG: hypothetical protein DWH97_06040 [Planctomycetota bacterium]RLS92721.1 MAG: hypothetical protein DWI12_10670 [Planctomycetota bacterium]
MFAQPMRVHEWRYTSRSLRRCQMTNDHTTRIYAGTAPGRIRLTRCGARGRSSGERAVVTDGARFGRGLLRGLNRRSTQRAHQTFRNPQT